MSLILTHDNLFIPTAHYIAARDTRVRFITFAKGNKCIYSKDIHVGYTLYKYILTTQEPQI